MPQVFYMDLGMNHESSFIVSGKVLRSQITRLSEECERKFTSIRLNTPEEMSDFYSMSLSDVEIEHYRKDGVTSEENVAESKFSKNSEGKVCFEEFSFSKSKPKVYIINESTGFYDPVDLVDEIPEGTPVTIVCKKELCDDKYQNVFDGIYIRENYLNPYSGIVVAQAKLHKLGIFINPDA